MIMEDLTGTKLYDEVQRRFLRPLQLTRVQPTTSRRVPGLVPGYAGPRDPLGLPDEVMTNGVFVINPQFEWTGGGYATSARDLARWGAALVHRESDHAEDARLDDRGSSSCSPGSRHEIWSGRDRASDDAGRPVVGT